ncbi:MAG: ABC transporter permease [Chlorobi bacterium]|nr:ABC transporter permease [Chlorobiota bacterium]
MKNLTLAWRNLWRNKRRTLITSASIFFGVIFSTVMTSMQFGSYDKIIDNVVKFYTGYIQIFTEDYHKNKTINNTIEFSDSLKKIIEEVPQITVFTPRLEYFSLASSEDLTKGAVIIGVDPEKENQVTGLKRWVSEGNYLRENDSGVLVAVDLANYLNIKVGDTLVLYGQGYHGVMAAGLYPVRGILKFPSPDLNKQFIYMSLPVCQDFFSTGNKITSVVLMVKDHYHLPHALSNLKKKIKPPLMVMSWRKLQPALVSMIEADRAGGMFMKAILYMVIAFGIFATILMMVSERKRELGVMVSIGMQRSRLGAILFLETLFMGLLGAFMGLLGSFPIVYYYFKHPIEITGNAAKTYIDMGFEPYLYFTTAPFVFYTQALTVFIITAFIAIYPVYKSFTFNVIRSLRA